MAIITDTVRLVDSRDLDIRFSNGDRLPHIVDFSVIFENRKLSALITGICDGQPTLLTNLAANRSISVQVKGITYLRPSNVIEYRETWEGDDLTRYQLTLDATV